MRPHAIHLLLGLTVSAWLSSGCKKHDENKPNPAAKGSDEEHGGGKPDFAKKAEELAKRFIIVDGHIDVPYRLSESRDKDGKVTEDVSQRTEKGHFDYPRAVKGGLDAPFMAIYIPAELQKKAGASKKLADELIDMVEDLAKTHPDKFALARSPADVVANFKDGKMSLALGMENGSPIETDLANVEHFYDRGIRYITLTHAKSNAICDSSYDENRAHGGLSEFGKKVVLEMNRVGIMVDVSHVTDQAFYQVMELTKVPAIASHSSLRHFTPGFERNMDDEMVKRLAENGGVIMINFGSWFISEANQKAQREREKIKTAFAKEHGLSWGNPKDRPKIRAFVDKKHPIARGTVDEVADHIDRAVKLAGIDHVGLGSDFDGVGTLPEGLDDVSRYPNLIRVLLEREYSEEEIEKLCSGNLLRIWRSVEAHAAKAGEN